MALGQLAAAVTDAGVWGQVTDLLATHRVAALAAIRLAGVDRVPSDVRAQLENERRDSAFHALAASAELTAVLRTLRAAGISAMPFKGPALALVAYGDIGVRRMVDADVVVDPVDRQRAFAALAAAGWRWPAAGERTRDVLHRWLGHVPIERSDATYGVELHWRFAQLALPWTLPVAEVLRCARPIASAPDALWVVPRPSDHLLLLAWHGTRHGWTTLEWIASFAHVMQACGEHDAGAALGVARGAGGARALGIAVAVACEVIDVGVPAAFESVAADPVVRAESANIVARLWTTPAGVAGEEQSWGRHGYWLRCLDGGASRARFLALTALLPTERELEMVRLPDSLAGLYYPLHLARVAARALLRRTA